MNYKNNIPIGISAVGDNPDEGHVFISFNKKGELSVKLPDGSITTIKNKANWCWTGARNTGGSIDRDMSSGGVFTNQSPFICVSACRLIGISVSTANPATWEAHVYKNGTSIASLSISSSSKGQTSNIDINFAAGDEVRLRQENSTGNVDIPRIMVFFEEII